MQEAEEASTIIDFQSCFVFTNFWYFCISFRYWQVVHL